MATIYTLVFTLLFLSYAKVDEPTPLFVIWNVGQGSWSTLITNTHCYHFDMGGEFYPYKSVEKCRQKLNLLYLSHADWDHMSFISKFSNSVPNFCIDKLPKHSLKIKKSKTLSRLNLCANNKNSPVSEIEFDMPLNSDSNNLSRVYSVMDVLLPGDSGKKAEAHWSKKIRSSHRILIAGHHGSRTSSSEELLSSLKKLNYVIISSRKKKYGHPHIQTTSRLAARRIPFLTTEFWGNIIIEL